MTDKNDKLLKELDVVLSSSESEKRWKIAVELTDLAMSDPEALWPLIVKYGSSEDEDVRDQIATCALEHLMEGHFCKFIERIEALCRIPNLNFLDTLKRCWVLGEAEKPENTKRLEKILNKEGRSSKK